MTSASGGVLLEQSQGLFGVGFGDIGAVEDVDEFLSGRRGLVREGGEQGGDVLRGPGQRAVAQAQVVACVDVEAVKVGIARGVGDLHGHDAGEAVGHGGLVLARLHAGVEGEHRADALRDGFRRDDDDLARGELRRGLRGHDDVLVVGQDEDDLRRGLFNRVEDVLGRGVHGLPALDDLVDAKIAEHAREPFARAHGDAAVALFGRGRAIRLRRGLAFQLLFHGLEIVGRPGLAPGGQIVVLQAHVLDLRQLQRPILLGLAQRVARNVRMYVDLEGLVVLADDETVADAAEILAQRVERGDILALADDKDRVEGKGDVLRVKNAEISLFVRRARVLADNVVAAQALEHAAQDQAEAHAARVDDAGLFEDGVLVDSIVERGVRGVQAVLEHVFDLAVFSSARSRAASAVRRETVRMVPSAGFMTAL